MITKRAMQKSMLGAYAAILLKQSDLSGEVLRGNIRAADGKPATATANGCDCARLAAERWQLVAWRTRWEKYTSHEAHV